ncbi:MAG: HlyD family type I secretion periplasmic adaptor subunit [Rhodospirillaceae bacterium]|jgi:HlyD family type I secretion membrane fusion protein|nr:HlyD family type I secretion periplasmic adaptor subunit [Rhodospirillaceae bacterium]MBT4167567.1 HlyD family type I secretion periplasmic adaptor subunit [Rhodospirillaceae bacterium]MBT4742955.1 HlyD family type I secretion periplasmic adaptor subunit [Rhodospirillaceae bacterium]MBT5129781.1 HlyD family type I secretion periplasmic adaptor subunit [Rhodospirillaceae bacterium]MBT6977726.1 HlyD family type I secretion periplasmic adaptor subunit [Rhodospirillaceae bacterium]
MNETAVVARKEIAPPAVILPKYEPPETESRRLRLNGVVTAGVVVFLAFFGAFGSWAVWAPLDSAAVASGSVKVEGERKTVQHLEGGIVDLLLVREGLLVKAGAVLLRLDDTQARAQLELLDGRHVARAALAARLRAERDSLAKVQIPPFLQGRVGEASVAAAIAAQIGVFDVRQASLAGETEILRQRIAQSGDEVKGLKDEIAAQDEQIDLINREIEGLEKLFAKGLTPLERLLTLKRQRAEIRGYRAKNRASVARAGSAVSEIEQRIIELRNRILNEAVTELSEVESELFDLQQQKRAAKDVLRRTELTAPVDGVVVGLRFHTAGGVIQPGESVLDLVPIGGHLVIEARVQPDDIDVVQAGQGAQVRVTAFNQRDLPAMEGTVVTVSADSLVDERTGEPYYVAQIKINDEEIGKLGEYEMQPGMPAEVMIRTGARTMFDYLLEPLLSTLRRAMRES